MVVLVEEERTAGGGGTGGDSSVSWGHVGYCVCLHGRPCGCIWAIHRGRARLASEEIMKLFLTKNVDEEGVIGRLGIERV